MRWRFPSAAPLPGSEDAAGRGLKYLAALLGPGFEEAIEALSLLGFRERALPAAANPGTQPTVRKGVEEVDQIVLEGGMGLDEYGEASSARWFDIEAVAANDPAAHSLENLGRFRRGEMLQIGLQALHHELTAQELFDDRRQVAERRCRPKIILPVLGGEEVGAEIFVAKRRLDARPGLDRLRREPLSQ